MILRISPRSLMHWRIMASRADAYQAWLLSLGAVLSNARSASRALQKHTDQQLMLLRVGAENQSPTKQSSTEPPTWICRQHTYEVCKRLYQLILWLRIPDCMIPESPKHLSLCPTCPAGSPYQYPDDKKGLSSPTSPRDGSEEPGPLRN